MPRGRRRRAMMTMLGLGGTPNLHFPHLHGTQIYTNPKFTRDPDLHGTHIYTAQIYTNPFPYIDSKKPKFTQPKFTQNPNLHNPTLHITQIYTKLFLQILLKLYKVNSIINPGHAALEVQPHMKQLCFHPELLVSQTIFNSMTLSIPGQFKKDSSPVAACHAQRQRCSRT